MAPNSVTKTDASEPVKPPHGNSGNAHRVTHGLRRNLVVGKLPKGSSYISRLVARARREWEAAVEAAGGTLGAAEAAIINAACREETRALMASRWRRLAGDESPVADRLALEAAICAATAARNRYLDRLQLGDAAPGESGDGLEPSDAGDALGDWQDAGDGMHELSTGVTP